MGRHRKIRQGRDSRNCGSFFFDHFNQSPYLYFTITPFQHPPFHHFTILPFTQFPVQSLLFTPKPCFLHQYLVLPRVLLAVPRVVFREGVPVWLGCVCSLVRDFTLGVQFNLLSRSLITDPSTVTIYTGDWGVELCGSSMSRTLQQRLKCVRLSTPVLAKGVIPFSLP